MASTNSTPAENSVTRRANGPVASKASSSIAKGLAQSRPLATNSLFKLKKSSAFIWHAWLGTALATENRVTEFAKSMATKGSEAEAKAQERLVQVKSTALKTNAKVKAKIGDGKRFVSQGLEKSLHLMRVPTRGDLNKLALLMNDMSKSIEQLSPSVSSSSISRGARRAQT